MQVVFGQPDPARENRVQRYYMQPVTIALDVLPHDAEHFIAAGKATDATPEHIRLTYLGRITMQNG